MKKCIILSALGEKSFSEEQIKKLKKIKDITFKKQKNALSEKKFIETVKEYEVVAVTRRVIKELSAKTLSTLVNLKALAIYSTGYEWADTDYLKKKGIKTAYLPGYSTTAVAEHTMAMLLAAFTRLHLSYDYSRNLIDNKKVSLRGYELSGKNAGIIGYGRIGRKVHSFLRPFGVKVKFYDADASLQNKFLKDYAGFDDIISKSDIIILCCSKKRGEKPIIGYSKIKKMKNGVVIINPARADLVNNKGIIKGLKLKKIFTYAVDEKTGEFNKKNTEPGRVIETGHTAWYRTEALERGTKEWVDGIIGLCSGKNVNLIGE